MRAAVLGVGVFGPGLPDWNAARAVFRGEAAYMHTANAVPPATLLPAAERRRATTSTRLALTAAQEALANAGVDPKVVPAVFASSSGSAEVLHDICEMLAAGDYQISPTKFHNSVHNAASGYYSIAVGSRRGATSVCAYDDSAAAGLLEAVTQAVDGNEPVLLVSFDLPYPFPLSSVRPIQDAWAIGIVLGRDATRPQVTVTIDPTGSESTLEIADLASVPQHNPTARLLPLVAALARGGAQRVALARKNGALRIDVR